MRKINPIFLLLIIAMTGLLVACPGKDPQPKSRTELITKNWKVQEVAINGSAVYTDPFNSGVDLEDYSAYRLNFTSPTTFSRIESDGNPGATGTWTFVANTNESRISFSDGIPAEVTIEKIEENALVISYIIQNQKTGNKEYRIQLVPAQ